MNESGPGFSVDSLSNALFERNSNSSACYALIDAGQFYDAGMGEISAIRRHEIISLLGEHAAPDATFAGPLLVPLHLPASAAFIGQLVDSLFGMNAVSFISSSVPRESLAAHLRWLTDVKHEDGTEWVMRYFDPRILPCWLSVLTQEQKSKALAPVDRWIYQDIHSGMTTFAGDDRAGAPIAETLLLSNAQHERIMSDTLPYMMLTMLESDDPMVFRGISYRAKARTVTNAIRQGQELGLHTEMDLKLFCFIAISVGSGFVNDERVQDALASAPEGQFHARVAEWEPEVWNRISGEQI